MPERPPGLLRRIPAFCAGCPHGTSTRLPEGSFATAGIGCHFMALDDGDQTRTFTQMGGEGAPFVGMAPFTDTPHVFANIGDGTYTHSGIMAIRQAVAAKARITYKLLVNDAVAMTGGQPAEGNFSGHRDRRAGRRGRCRAHRAGGRRRGPAAAGIGAAARHDAPYARETRCGAARTARLRRRLGADLRPGLRHREAPPPQAGQDGAADAERRDQRAGMRELRRLLGAVGLHRDRAGGDLARPQAPHQSDQLQRRSVVPEGLLPELRHRRRPAERAGCRSALAGARGRTRRRSAAAVSPATDETVARAVRRHRRRRHRHVGCDPGDGGASGRQGGAHARLHRAGAEERHRGRACADRR